MKTTDVLPTPAEQCGTAPAADLLTPAIRAGHEGHNPYDCAGCTRILTMEDLVVVLREPLHTLYKRSQRGFPAFPRRIRGRRGIAVTCESVKEYLRAVTS